MDAERFSVMLFYCLNNYCSVVQWVLCVFDVGVCDTVRPGPARPLYLLASDAMRLRRWPTLVEEALGGGCVERSRLFSLEIRCFQ